jgi:hypothetical protein
MAGSYVAGMRLPLATCRERYHLMPNKGMTKMETFDQGGTRAWKANAATWHAPPSPNFRPWQYLFAALAIPPLLAIGGAACWLLWLCAHAALGTQGAIIALAGLGAVTAFLSRRTGMGIGPTMILIALAGVVGLVWVVFVLVAWAIVVS